MPISLFLARAWGLYLLVISLAFLVNRKNLQLLLRVYENEGAVFLSGAASLVIGILNVLVHNLWICDWRVIITIFGWVALAKGVIRLCWPEWVLNKIKMVKEIKDSNWVFAALVLVLILGAYLSYIGFVS